MQVLSFICITSARNCLFFVVLHRFQFHFPVSVFVDRVMDVLQYMPVSASEIACSKAPQIGFVLSFFSLTVKLHFNGGIVVARLHTMISLSV